MFDGWQISGTTSFATGKPKAFGTGTGLNWTYAGTTSATNITDFTGGEVRVRVGVRKIQRYIVYRVALPHQIAHSLEIKREVRHYDPPWILFGICACGVEPPTRIFDTRGRVSPAVADELIYTLQEVDVCFSLKVERSGSKHRRMEPGPSLR